METTLLQPEGLSLLRARHPVQRMRTDALDWEYIDAGQGGVPLVLLPGALGNSETFYKQILRFGEKQRLISANYPAVADPGLICTALARLMTGLGVEKINLFGTSLGGYIAQRFAGFRADLIGKVMVANSFTRADRILASEAFDPRRASFPMPRSRLTGVRGSARASRSTARRNSRRSSSISLARRAMRISCG